MIAAILAASVALSLESGLRSAAVVKPPFDWDWTVIIGTGQSLSVGARADVVKSTVQPFGNLMVGRADLTWPVDPNDPKLTLIPLVEPAGRRATNYPSSWPTNIDGETPHTSAANEISYLVQQKFHRGYVTVHMVVGEDGQGMIRLKKNAPHQGVTGRSYEAAMVQTMAIARLAKAAGKKVGVGAIFVTHGESDTGNVHYEDELYKLWSDYNTDVKEITGQTRDVLMIVSQHNHLGTYSPSTIAQWKAGEDHSQAIVCSGPKYQYAYAPDLVHLTADGYRELGEKYGEVYFERLILGHRWLPLEPLRVKGSKNALSIQFHVPVKPLVWDTEMPQPHSSFPEWANGKGFEIVDRAGQRVTIRSARIRGGDTVMLELAADPGPGARVSYAMIGEPTLRKAGLGGEPHWGLLRDSDPFVGYNTQVAQPNYCVAFDITLP